MIASPTMRRWLERDSRARRLALASAVYVLATAVYFAFAARATLAQHTPWNHFALLAESWLAGRVDLGGPPPAYAGYNDFALFEGKWFIVFPPFPAVLLLPLVALGGRATDVQDGQLFIWLAGIGPAALLLALEKLRRAGRAHSRARTSLLLALLFAFGTVYFFTAEQGTVWYAAHVVSVALAAFYLLFALEAERPLLAGTMLGLGFLTRSPLLLAAPLFLLEAWRVSIRPEAGRPEPPPEPRGGSPYDRARTWLRGRLACSARVDRLRLLKLWGLFLLPLAGAVLFALWHNQARFGDPFDFGYRHLRVAWQTRMQHWGLFHYHYLAKNLGVMLTSLPWITKPPTAAPLQINAHGLALWVTSPFYLWLLWPRQTAAPHRALWITTLAVALPTLLYQNTGWIQFGYRFSNDYAVFLFALLAIGGYRLRTWFVIAACWAVLVNAFGAATFNRAKYQAYYYVDRTQRVLYQPD
jgi:hypothetical protein